ncbi:thiamine phosphate synthase [Nitrosospira sp. NRS527]|uniref:thiamine phosphate synthase n=1 Tax=Nitrosospira sp. NRS527 TaxID=155925 RepID=UPI001AF83CAC|nr:thiamine phosphate synthase [Nitrosospira sp. NRS527]BCT69296.1 Thiamine-phosphate synthase [Nitrosospira sp. NRS527]
MTRPEILGLYAITPEATDTASLLAMTQQALAGGARLIQYRSKTDDVALRLEQAQSLARLCAEFDVPFIINDYPDLALEVDADGVHLGKGDAPITEARRKLGPGKIIGISCYERLEYAVEAERQGADYVAFGAFFASITKPDAVSAPADLLRHAKQKLRIPIVAIGGIIPENAGELIRQGADAVAVSNALFNARHIRSAAERFSLLFKPDQHFISPNHGLANNVT